MSAIRYASPPRTLLVPILVAALASAASAAGPVVVQDPGATIASPLHATYACSYAPGPLDPTTSFGAGDGFQWIAWHVPNQPCGNCPSPGITEARQVSFATRAFGSCAVNVEVSIVASTGGACPMPDTTNVLDGPFSYPVAIPIGVGNVHSIPLPTGWCLTQDAFVLLRFDGIDGCLTSKGPVGFDRANVTCMNCDQWFTAINAYPTPADECVVFSTIPSPIWIQLDTECCTVTPTIPRSWGSVKTLYR